MHYSCAVITPPDDEPEIVADHVTRLMSPYQGFHNGAGWWDWYQIGGRWAGSLISEQGIRGDRSLVDDRPDEEVYTTSRHCDAAPIDSIDWDAVGADQVKSLTRLYHSDPIRDLPPNSIDRSMHFRGTTRVGCNRNTSSSASPSVCRISSRDPLLACGK